MFGYVWIYSTMEKWEVEMMFEKHSLQVARKQNMQRK